MIERKKLKAEEIRKIKNALFDKIWRDDSDMLTYHRAQVSTMWEIQHCIDYMRERDFDAESILETLQLDIGYDVQWVADREGVM